MRILVAPDSFKDCMSSKDVSWHIEQGILRTMPEAIIEKVPLADGGEGTVEAMVESTKGEIITTKVHDPLMRKIESNFGILGDKETGIVGMSAASGLELLAKGERDPTLTTTYGTGELIKSALDHGCKRIVVGIGGSATNDGGVGMMQALGVKFYDEKRNSIGYGGKELLRLRSFDISGLDKRLKKVKIKVACDVSNPLFGPTGAAYVYSPQKGATPEMVELLDSALQNYAKIVYDMTGKDIANIPGSGAAGGLSAGLLSFLNASLVSGVQLVMETIGFEQQMVKADLAITGEGTIDKQTLYGKAPFRVGQIALKYNKPVIGIAGALGKGYNDLFNHGFTTIISIVNESISVEEAIKNAGMLIENTIENVLKTTIEK